MSILGRGSQGPFGARTWAIAGAIAGLALGAILWRDGMTEVLVTRTVALGLWTSVGISIPLGAILAIIAAVYPAQQAAKMPPAAALRVEI